MKKLICLILSLTMLLGLVACTDGDNETTTQSSTTQSSTSATTSGVKVEESLLLKAGTITSLKLNIQGIRGYHGEKTLTGEDIKSILAWLESVEINSNKTKLDLMTGGFGCGFYFSYENGEEFYLGYQAGTYCVKQFYYGDFPDYTAHNIEGDADKVLSDFCDLLEDLGIDLEDSTTVNRNTTDGP